MVMKAAGRPSNEIGHRWADGFTWIRGDDGGVWLVDPLGAGDPEGVLDRALGELGRVRGVVVLSSYHSRDAAAFATTYEVPVYVPSAVSGVVDRLHAADDWSGHIVRFSDELADTGFQCIEVGNRLWSEVMLYHPSRKTLVVSDVLTTAAHHTNGSRQLSFIPFVQLFPPRDAFDGLDVDRVLVGHGESVFTGAQTAVDDALALSVSDAVVNVFTNLPTLIKIAYHATRN